MKTKIAMYCNKYDNIYVVVWISIYYENLATN